MADAKKCDICGQFYDIYNVDDTGTGHTVDEIHNGFNFVSIGTNGEYEDGTPIECCPGCIKSIEIHIEQLKKTHIR